MKAILKYNIICANEIKETMHILYPIHNMFLSRIHDLVQQNILRIKKYTASDHASYYIVNCNDDFKRDGASAPSAHSAESAFKRDGAYSAYKSVIITADEPSRILAFAPPHSMDYDAFKESVDFVMTDDIIANNAIEGTMINLFFDERINAWNIATRGSIGGNNRFYSNGVGTQNFKSMFMDCLCTNGAGETMDSVFADWPKNACYSFVLQHPQNQIVFDVSEPRLYLVAAYTINNEANSLNIEDYVASVPLEELSNARPSEGWSLTKLARSREWNMMVPQPYSFSRKFGELECVFSDADGCMGVMFWNTKTGVRSHMENTKYVALRALRGNHPNMLYQFLELHQSGKVWDFLEAFPRYSSVFKEYYDKIIHFSYLVYGAYEKYYIKRDREHIPKEYFVHAAKIHHEIFVPKKNSGETVYITPMIVKNYVENIPPIKLVHYLQNHQV